MKLPNKAQFIKVFKHMPKSIPFQKVHGNCASVLLNRDGLLNRVPILGDLWTTGIELEVPIGVHVQCTLPPDNSGAIILKFEFLSIIDLSMWYLHLFNPSFPKKILLIKDDHRTSD